MARPYQQAGLIVGKNSAVAANIVRALQTDLRALGYLRAGIDGQFGDGSAAAVRALCWDLLHNDGASTETNGRRAPVSIASYNRGRVSAKTDEVDQALAASIAELIEDPAVPKLPRSASAAADNRRALAAIMGAASRTAPGPFIAAMSVQESSGMHFREPSGGDEDSFITVGLDRNDKADPDRITSRGYGLGQATIFHHPPWPEEIAAFMIDTVANVQHALAELRSKFDGFVAGPTDRADDRTAEHPMLPLRLCRYVPTDPKYMRDCQCCAAAATRVNITAGTPAYSGASFGYKTDQYYPSCTYNGVPNRADFLCDWPYAARRYNGSGNDSFHYQTRILLNLLAEPPLA